jgi:UDP-N-acetylmuramate: L-alanyl-gamma-D-glutamyl-meso-diaminopimelate ligase
MKVHLSAICGTAMASLAGLLRERGHEVTGSDQDVYPPMSTQLADLGIRILSPYAEANVPADADLVVIGNALSRGNPEVEVVLDRRQRYTSLPALVAEEFLRLRTPLVVAGTHGKTTTASLLAFLLDRAGASPSFLIGGVPVDFGRSYGLGRGPHFVIEGDEYDCAFFDKRPKFVHYLPSIAVVNNVEYDHADIYPDLASVQVAFARLVDVVPRGGLLVAGTESPALCEILSRARCRVETFGLHPEADWRAEEVRAEGEGSRFRLVRAGRGLGEFALSLPGEHNVRNALAALAAAAGAGFEPEALRAGLAAFRGVRRRLEVRGRAGGVTVYDDFAHHPTAVAATLAALRGRTGQGRLVAVFEPRSYTARTRLFQEDFASALARADRVIVAAVHLPGKLPEDRRLSETGLVRGIEGHGTPAAFVPGVGEIVETLSRELRPGDTVVVLSNGGFGGVHDKLLDRLERAAAAESSHAAKAPGSRDPSML